MYFIATTTYIGLTLVEKTPTKIELLICKGIGLLIIIIIGLTTIRAGIEQPDSTIIIMFFLTINVVMY